jgi:hypothetical protein
MGGNSVSGEPSDLYCPLDMIITRNTKSTVKWARHVECTSDIRNLYKIIIERR